MDGEYTTQFTDVEKFKQAVEETDDDALRLSSELKGAPMGCTVETLIECANTYDDPMIVTSSRGVIPDPLGASFKVETLHEAVELIEELGTHCIEDFVKHDDGSAEVGYHFD
jgi:hypothetical protein